MFQRFVLSFAFLGLAFIALQGPAAAQDKAGDKAAMTVAHIRLHGELDELPVAADPLFGTSSAKTSKARSTASRKRSATSRSMPS